MAAKPRPGLDFASLLDSARSWRATLADIKRGTPLPGADWYPYDTIANLDHISALLRHERPNFFAEIDGPVADIGAGDGDFGLFLARRGFDVDLIDWPATNANGMKALRTLAPLFGVDSVHAVDLDADFVLPRPRYGLVLLLGTLYHLKNPFHVLERLAAVSGRCLISTKVARFTADRSVPLVLAPVAYLLDERECNDDPSNFWIFSEPGFRRLASRCGWEVRALVSLGNTTNSDPATPEGDERIFALLESKRGG